ncbi:hypothetical protein VTK26DRAFT_6069 [Humicola hyalothermophila]
MATQVNPYHVNFDQGRRRTRAEAEAIIRSAAFSYTHNQPTRPLFQPARVTKVSEWLANQGLRLSSADFEELNPINSPRPGQRNLKNIHSRAEAPPSSRHFPTGGRKRKVSRLDDKDGIAGPQAPPYTLEGREIVDLTLSDGPKRKTSFLGHQDDDVMIIDPPAAEIRRDLRPLLLGTLRGSDGTSLNPDETSGDLDGTSRESNPRPAKRAKQTHRRSPTRNVGQGIDRNVEVGAVEANAPETSVVLQSIESTTSFFNLPIEIRDKIYRHLLISSKPIHVQHLWTELARRPTRRGRGRSQNGLDVVTTIDTQILRVCRRTALEGTRILYSENTFLYQLRDPEILDVRATGGRRSNRIARAMMNHGMRAINLEKYGHLIRHMAIELEPNRTGAEYQDLMAAALEILVSPAQGSASPGIPPPCRPPCGPIHLQTLTITISPVFESNRRTVRSLAAGHQDVAIRNGRFLSVVGFFSRGAAVLKALQRIDTKFLRINVHVNSNARNRHSREDASNPDPNTSDEEDSGSDSGSNSASTRPRKYKPRHLETTLDLRYRPRHLEVVNRQEADGAIWGNARMVHMKRRRQGEEAEATLANLRRHIEDACLKSEKELRRGIWEEHRIAERRRREHRAREEARFDADAYDEEDGADEEDGRLARDRKSLIISIDRVGDGLRAYRP